jgi:hypothetical protein
LPCHESGLKGDDHTHEESDQQHDRHSVGTRLGSDIQDIAPVDAAAARDRAPKFSPAFTDKVGNLRGIGDLMQGRAADVLEDARIRLAADRSGVVFLIDGVIQKR